MMADYEISIDSIRGNGLELMIEMIPDEATLIVDKPVVEAFANDRQGVMRQIYPKKRK